MKSKKIRGGTLKREELEDPRYTFNINYKK